MLFFHSKKRLSDTGMLYGATDWHSHILPGVDDGIPTMGDSLRVLKYYEQLGIRNVWLTPHIMEDMPNTPDELRNRFSSLLIAYNGPVKLHLAAENMIDNLFAERLAQRNLLPLGEHGNHLLVETSYYQPPINLYKTLMQVREAGYQPVLAHPERYVYMTNDDYERLAGMRVKLQLNLISLVGAYGQTAMEKAQYLLSHGYYTLFGSDLHRLEAFANAIIHKGWTDSTLKNLQKIPNRLS